MKRPTPSSEVDPTRRRNRLSVLTALREAGGGLSRTALSVATGLSNAAISSLTAEMIEDGLLTPAEAPRTPARGRPQAPLAPAATIGSVLTIGVSAQKIGLRLVDYSGAPLARHTAPAPAPNEELSGSLPRVVASGFARVRAPDLAQVVLVLPGVMDPGRTSVHLMPGVRGAVHGLAAVLEAAFGAPVVVLGRAEALARAAVGAHGDFLLLALGPVLDAALVRGGVPVPFLPGGFGHMNYRPGGAACACGARGCLAAYAGDAAIWRTARGQAPMRGGAEAMQTLSAAARSGEPGAVAAFAEAGRAIGHGLGALTALMGPVPVLVAGPEGGALDLMQGGIEEGRRAATPPFLPLDARPAALDGAHTVLGGAMRAGLAALDARLAATRPAPLAKP